MFVLDLGFLYLLGLGFSSLVWVSYIFLGLGFSSLIWVSCTLIPNAQPLNFLGLYSLVGIGKFNLPCKFGFLTFLGPNE